MAENTQVSLVQDGTTSVALDTELLQSAAGLILDSVDNIVKPNNDEFTVGFDITEESSFLFSSADGLTPIGGEIEHTGIVTFSSSAGDITVGDFAIGFDAARQSEDTSGFYVENTVEGVLADGAIIFDVGNPDSLEVSEGELSIGSADLLVAPEFAGTLVDADLAASDLTGADVGDASIDVITDDLTGLDIGLVQDGTTKVLLDSDLLQSAAGLTLDAVDNVVDPKSDQFAVGFDITEESDFLFSNADGFAPVGGEIEHTGTVTFSSGAGDITVGDFAIGFDAARQSENISGFYVENTVEGVLADGAIIFDVGNPNSLAVSEGKLSIGSADLLVAPEFAGTLVDADLAASDLTGADIGDVKIDATFI